MPTLQFKGKTFVQNYHHMVKYHELIPQKEKSLTDRLSLHDNLIIHGDNLVALKALLPTYAGKVKCIYIDPPYNTGNEKWIYNDNVSNPMMKEWLGKVVDREDLTRHDKWLCMMMPRLKLLRELLSEDGVIFISIDDHEVHNLLEIMDEIFLDNFISIFIWKGKSGAEDDKYFRIKHEFILCYAKNKNKFSAGMDVKENEKFPFFDPVKQLNYKRQLARKWGSNSRREDRPRLFYPINSPSGEEIFPKLDDGSYGCWRWKKEKMEFEISEGNIDFVKENDEWIVYQKIFDKKDLDFNPTKKYNTWLDNCGSSSTGTNELKEIFSSLKTPFLHPKPSTLVKKILKMAKLNRDSLVLDSFAGSGTTAHAVLALNQEDGGKRRFILVECEDYADEITAERVRRVIKGVPSAKDENLRNGLGGSFSYFELGKPIELESILEGDSLPSYRELARYIFYTATGEEFNPSVVDEKRFFIGENKEYELYLFYKPDIEYLKSTALTLERAQALGPINKKKRLVFAPTKYLDTEHLLSFRIEFCQLPFEIFKIKG